MTRRFGDTKASTKWWRPVPRVPTEGLSEGMRRHLEQAMEKANQIVKLSMATNTLVLEDMEIPESYLANLPRVRMDKL